MGSSIILLLVRGSTVFIPGRTETSEGWGRTRRSSVPMNEQMQKETREAPTAVAATSATRLSNTPIEFQNPQEKRHGYFSTTNIEHTLARKARGRMGIQPSPQYDTRQKSKGSKSGGRTREKPSELQSGYTVNEHTIEGLMPDCTVRTDCSTTH